MTRCAVGVLAVALATAGAGCKSKKGAESKTAALGLPVPFIVTEGRKGGSPIAVAILHALLLLSAEAS